MTVTTSTAAHGSQYSTGDRVQTFEPRLRDGEQVPWYIGTVINHYRNNCFNVHDEHGTTRVHHISKMTSAR